ncbi:MAG: MFS transporter [Candidatus Nanopelagicaceae bacterium]
MTSLKQSVSSIRINFFFMGVLLGGWSTRIPELKSALKMSDATLGKTLIGSSIAAFLSSRIIGKLILNLGTKKVFYLGSCVFPIGYLLIAYAPNPFFVFLGIIAFVMGYMFLDNPLTIITQEIEAEQKRKYLSGFHAFWSIGTLAAAFFGSFLIGRVKYSYHLTGIAVIVFAVLVVNGKKLAGKKPNQEKVETSDLPWFSPLGRIVILIGIGMMLSNGAEFGATDWSALFLRDVLAITGQLYVGAYIAFESGMIISRILGDKYIHQFGAAKVIKISGLVGSLVWLSTMIVGVSIDHFNRPLAYLIILIGYFAAGSGVGPLFPGFLTILGSTPGINMGIALSRAFLVAMIGVAIIPATIGFISDATSLTIGMLLPIALLFAAGVLSRIGKE